MKKKKLLKRVSNCLQLYHFKLSLSSSIDHVCSISEFTRDEYILHRTQFSTKFSQYLKI